ncbi:MAG: lipopolysaccharide heptosyltransferase II [Nitrospirae bacterium]|nr:lipopolysaccharide heptosyltransferase II [Nitrospirota bacterium]
MKILIIKPSSLGDIIHALPFLKAVKDTYPESQVDWVVSKNLKGLLEGNPLINELIVFDKDSMKALKNLPKTIIEIRKFKRILNTKYYEIIADLQGLLRSGLITHFTPGALKIGFADGREGSSLFYGKKVSAQNAVHAVDKNLLIAKAIGASVKKIDFPLYVNSSARDKITELLKDSSEYVLIAPSARWMSKRWPPEYFASLISKINMPVVITGSLSDMAIVQEIKDESPGKIIDLCGKTDLKELIALIDGARAVVSNDSGPMHIAAALNKPVIAFFGPTDYEKTGPYGWQNNKDLNVLRASAKCSPCFKRRCKDLVCMKGITVETAYNALRRYL